MELREVCRIGKFLQGELLAKVILDVIEGLVYSGDVLGLGWIRHGNADFADWADFRRLNNSNYFKYLNAKIEY